MTPRTDIRIVLEGMKRNTTHAFRGVKPLTPKYIAISNAVQRIRIAHPSRQYRLDGDSTPGYLVVRRLSDARRKAH